MSLYADIYSLNETGTAESRVASRSHSIKILGVLLNGLTLSLRSLKAVMDVKKSKIWSGMSYYWSPPGESIDYNEKAY